MPESELHKRIEELESENRLLRTENKRLRGILDLPPIWSEFATHIFYLLLRFVRIDFNYSRNISNLQSPLWAFGYSGTIFYICNC